MHRMTTRDESNRSGPTHREIPVQIYLSVPEMLLETIKVFELTFGCLQVNCYLFYSV